MPEKLSNKIKIEIDQINNLLDYHNTLFVSLKKREPDSTEITAIGSILHSFYNGIERIFNLIAKHFDRFMPTSSQWHKELLKVMKTETNKRPAVIKEITYQTLLNYLGFRHFFRNSYDYMLDWEELKNLLYPLYENWKMIQDDFNIFINFLNSQK